MGAEVRWQQSDKTVLAVKDGLQVILPVGKKQATVDEQTITLDQPAMVVEGRVVVPLRFLANARREGGLARGGAYREHHDGGRR